jgi:hypothetical protein
MTVSLGNGCAGQTRRLAARIDVALAGGQLFANWRRGYTNVAAGEAYTVSWNQTIGAVPSLIGDSTFTLEAEDVTPSPYNLPPYPPSGDTDTDGCTVTGAAP